MVEPTPWHQAKRPLWPTGMQRCSLRVQLRCSPHIRGKAVGLLGQYLWRHEAGGPDHALVLFASILTRGCQTKVTCSSAGLNATHDRTDSLKGWRN